MFRARAAVPEATIDENRKPLATKYEVRFPKQPLAAPPSSYAMSVEQFDHSKFCILIAAATYPRHHLGSSQFGENVVRAIDCCRHQSSTYAVVSSSAIKPGSRASGVPTNIALSRPWLIVSHEVSGSKMHAWHAAKFAKRDP